jgi:hypothetical protein
MSKWFDLATALCALAAAILWFWSASGKLPPMVAYWNAALPPDPFYKAIKLSASLNRWAAGFSGLSALCAFLSYMTRS